jgi:hypothetical protein
MTNYQQHPCVGLSVSDKKIGVFAETANSTSELGIIDCKYANIALTTNLLRLMGLCYTGEHLEILAKLASNLEGHGHH